MQPLHLLLLVAAALLMIAVMWRVRPALRSPAMPFTKRCSLMPAAEHRFDRALLAAVPPGLVVCPKVRLMDVVKVPDDLPAYTELARFLNYRGKRMEDVREKLTEIRSRFGEEKVHQASAELTICEEKTHLTVRTQEARRQCHAVYEERMACRSDSQLFIGLAHSDGEKVG